MKKITRVQLTIIWLCLIWMVVVLAPLVPMWMWSGLHPGDWTQEQLDTFTIPVRKLREMEDRFREERNGYLFKVGPAVLVLLIVLCRISVKPDISEIDGKQTEPKSPETLS